MMMCIESGVLEEDEYFFDCAQRYASQKVTTTAYMRFTLGH